MSHRMEDGSGEKSLEVEIKECENFTSFVSESDCVSEALDRFPVLVWKKILENCWTWEYSDMLEFFGTVNLPGDFLSNLQMDSVRNNVVFHLLFPTLASNYVKAGLRRNPDHPSLLDFEDIHSCRLVCRAWNWAIRKNVVSHVARAYPNCCLHEWESNFLWPRESRNPYANQCNNAYPGFFDLLKGSLNLDGLRISWLSLHRIEAFWKDVNAGSGGCPDLKCLTHLEVNGVPHSLFNDIIRSNGSHIEKLKISDLEVSNYTRFRKFALHQIPLGNLLELRISFESVTESDIVRLTQSAPHWTKLKKLHLDFEGRGRVPKSISWDLILQCLNEFSETVTHVWLRFPTLTSELNEALLHDYCPTREKQLKLPNLEQIVLKFPEGSAFSLDFLCGLDKLETLYIHELGGSLALDPLHNKKFRLFQEYLSRRGLQKIKLSRVLKYSKIWEQFPKLSELYWRQIYKKYA